MAGVGTTTVSRYFNGGNLKKETYEVTNLNKRS